MSQETRIEIRTTRQNSTSSAAISTNLSHCITLSRLRRDVVSAGIPKAHVFETQNPALVKAPYGLNLAPFLYNSRACGPMYL